MQVMGKGKKRAPRRTKEEIKSQLSTIALFVRNKREELGYTQEELAFRAGLNPRFVKEFELGKQTVRLDKVSELVRFLGAELEVRVKGHKS